MWSACTPICIMYILSGKKITAVYPMSRRRWDQNTTQVDNRLDRARATYGRLLHISSMVHPHPHNPGNILEILRNPGNTLEIERKPKNRSETLYKGPLSNRFMEIVYHTTSLLLWKILLYIPAVFSAVGLKYCKNCYDLMLIFPTLWDMCRETCSGTFCQWDVTSGWCWTCSLLVNSCGRGSAQEARWRQRGQPQVRKQLAREAGGRMPKGLFTHQVIQYKTLLRSGEFKATWSRKFQTGYVAKEILATL